MNEKEKLLKTKKAVFTALFAAIICAGAFIRIPIPVGPVPIVIQNMLVILSGALLGPLQGAGATGLFLIAGAIGLPVFSGGRGGFPVLLGPTGGFLIGYFIAALITGLIIKKPLNQKKTPLGLIIVACTAGFISMYIPGVLRLQAATNIPFMQAIASGVIPFLSGDLVKLCISIPLVVKLRPIIARYISNDESEEVVTEQ